MSKKQFGVLILSVMISLQILAADKLYTVMSVGYSDLEFTQESNKGLGYKMAIGYQFDPQWYVEAVGNMLLHTIVDQIDNRCPSYS